MPDFDYTPQLSIYLFVYMYIGEMETEIQRD